MTNCFDSVKYLAGCRLHSTCANLCLCLSVHCVCVYISGSDEDEDSKTKRKRAKKEAKRDAKNNAKAQEAVGAEVRCDSQGAFVGGRRRSCLLYEQRICLCEKD